jgi:hypothetical protein
MDQEKKNILNEIKKSGTGFNTPEGYLESLEDRMGKTFQDLKNSKAKELDKAIEKTDDFPSLNKIDRKHGFSVPKGYFDQLESELTKSKNTKIISLNDRNKRLFYLSIAASILLFFGIQYMNTTEITSEQLLLQDQEIANWIEADLIHFDANEIAEAFSDVELEDPFYTDEEIFSYLNDIDIENLIIEN